MKVCDTTTIVVDGVTILVEVDAPAHGSGPREKVDAIERVVEVLETAVDDGGDQS